MAEISEENYKTLANLNDKLLEIFNDRGILVSYLLSPLPNIINPELTSLLKLVKDLQSKSVDGCLIYKQNQLLFMTNLWHSVIQIKSWKWKVSF